MTRIVRITLAAAALLARASAPRAQVGELHPLPKGDQCIACHAELDGELSRAVKLFPGDVHLAAGLSCADCHGGDPTREDPEESMDPRRGFVGTPGALEIPRFCDRCHGDAAYMKRYNPGLPIDQHAKYLTSVHGKLNQDGDTKAAHCASCHPAHNMKPAEDPTSTVYALNIPATCGSCHADPEYMRPYGIPTTQLRQYTESVHGQALLGRHDLGAPACNDCHGNHAASPPLTGAIANVCGNCHAFNAELFAQSPHRRPFAERGIPACEVCHGVHQIHVLGLEHLGADTASICLACHGPDDGTRGIAVGVRMKRALEGMERAYRRADSLLEIAERKGMLVEEARFQIKDARQAGIQARTLVHSFSDTVVAARVDSGLAILGAVSATAEKQIAESRFRRTGLTVSTLIISLLALLLYLKIRQIEGR